MALTNFFSFPTYSVPAGPAPAILILGYSPLLTLLSANIAEVKKFALVVTPTFPAASVVAPVLELLPANEAKPF